ncbi:MAG: class II aldolase/adducin family protein [Rhodococcus sp. (in: high G+C Gram-positive bacteria)]|uniref:class II aldolase/adducin family protein n=1 Tax=Rhodococcus sp. TaxID=1831 RepID=UPI003BB7CBAE
MSGDELDRAREEVAATSRELARQRLVLGTAGNVSVRVGDLVALTATGVTLATATADDVTVVGLDGRHHSGRLQPTSELGIHLGVYRDSDATAVVHAHSEAAVALSLVTDELPVVHYQQLLLGGKLTLVPFAPFGTEELTAATRAALRHTRAAILAHHGTVAVGSSLQQALGNAVLLEWLCRVYLRAAAVATPRPMTDEQLQAVVEEAVRTGYGQTRPVDHGRTAES